METNAEQDLNAKFPARFNPFLPGELAVISSIREGAEAVLDVQADGRLAEPSERRVRGDFIAWLLINIGDIFPHPPTRIAISGACIVGPIDIDFGQLTTSVVFTGCEIAQGFRGNYARTRSIAFAGGTLGQFVAVGMRVEDELSFEGTEVRGPVHLFGAEVANSLIIRNAVLDPGLPRALNGTAIKCGRIRVENTSILGEVTLLGAAIDGDLVFNAVQIAASGLALHCERTRIEGACFLTMQTRVVGGVSFLGAVIAGELNLTGLNVSGTKDPSLNLRRSVISSSVYLTDAAFNGLLVFQRATIKGDLIAEGTQIVSSGPESLDLRSSEIQGNVRITDSFKCDSLVTLYGAEIKGELIIGTADVGVRAGKSIDVRRATIGAVHLEGNVKASGTIDFYGTTLKGDLVVNGASTCAELKFGFCTLQGSLIIKNSILLKPVRAFRLSCDQLTIHNSTIGDGVQRLSWINSSRIGRLELIDARLYGGIGFRNSAISGDAQLVDLDFLGDLSGRNAVRTSLLDMSGSSVKGIFSWSSKNPAAVGSIDLGHARIGTFDVHENCWPRHGETRLDGFTYDRITQRSLDAHGLWLGLQKAYSSQPYEQLVKTYRAMGDSAVASEIAILKWRRRRETLPMWSFARLWDKFLDLASGYGYRPVRPLAGLLSVLAIGSVLYGHADRAGVFCAAETLRAKPPCQPGPLYPKFSAPLYSLEMLVPAGDFGQKRTWIVRGDKKESALIMAYTVIHRALGWIFSLLLALAPTNILRRE